MFMAKPSKERIYVVVHPSSFNSVCWHGLRFEAEEWANRLYRTCWKDPTCFFISGAPIEGNAMLEFWRQELAKQGYWVDHGGVAYADDRPLEAAVDELEHLPAFQALPRDSIFIACGIWLDPEFGCVDGVARILSMRGYQAEIDPSLCIAY